MESGGIIILLSLNFFLPYPFRPRYPLREEITVISHAKDVHYDYDPCTPCSLKSKQSGKHLFSMESMPCKQRLNLALNLSDGNNGSKQRPMILSAATSVT